MKGIIDMRKPWKINSFCNKHYTQTTIQETRAEFSTKFSLGQQEIPSNGPEEAKVSKWFQAYQKGNRSGGQNGRPQKNLKKIMHSKTSGIIMPHVIWT